MAGRSTRAVTEPAPKSMVASAVKWNGRIATPFTSTDRAWQEQAWGYFETVSELAFAANWMGNALSRCILLAGQVGKDGRVVETDDAKTQKGLAQLFSGPDGQPEILMALGIHLTVAGEAFLVGRERSTIGMQENPTGGLVWEVIGVTEMSTNGWVIEYGEGQTSVALKDSDEIIRIWRPHPKRRIEAYSPVRTLLPVLAEIQSWTDHIFAQINSRLAGAGILPLPASLEFSGMDTTANKADGFSKILIENMMVPLRDRKNAASLVPIVITVPDDVLEKMREPIHFWSDLDQAAIESRNQAIARFAVGMDMPPEVILGMTSGASSSGGRGTGASHWTAWQIEESAIKLHIEPLLQTIGNAIVTQYLREIVQNPLAAITYDTSAIKSQPDRSKEAFELADRGEISMASLRRECGFDETDAPNDKERLRFMLTKVAGASAAPEQLAAAMKILFPELKDSFPDGGGDDTLPPGTNQPQQPSLLEHPAPRGAPEASSLIPAAEALCLRAFERAGNRLRAAGSKPQGVPAHETHMHLGTGVRVNISDLLANAWDTAPIVFSEVPTSEAIVSALNTYVSEQIRTCSRHDRSLMARYLKEAA